MRSIGIDVGSSSIKIATLATSGKTAVLVDFKELKLSGDSNRDQSLEIITALRDSFSQKAHSGVRIAMAIPQRLVAGHLKRFPFSEPRKILSILPAELEDELPFNIDETSFGYKLLASEGKLFDVLAYSVAKSSLREWLALARDSGIDPDVVSVESSALANLFEGWSAKVPTRSAKARTDGLTRDLDQTTTGIHAPVDESSMERSSSRLILSLGHGHTTMLIYRDDYLIATRSFAFGGQAVAESLRRFYQVSPIDAQRILHERSFFLTDRDGASRDQLAMTDLMEQTFAPLIQELRLTLAELAAEHSLDFTQLDLTGGLAQIQSLNHFFANQLGIRTHLADLSPSSLVSLGPSVGQLPSGGFCAVGLAIEGLKSAQNPATNFRRDEFARENRDLQTLWANWKFPVQLGAAAVIGLSIYGMFRTSLMQTAVDRASEQLTTLARNQGPESTSTSNIRKYIKFQQDQARLTAKIEDLSSQASVFSILNELSAKAGFSSPVARVDMVYLSIKSGRLEIEGLAPDVRSLSAFRKALEGVIAPGSLKETEPTRIRSDQGPGLLRFAFSAGVRRK